MLNSSKWGELEEDKLVAKPEDIVREQCYYLSELTNNVVRGYVKTIDNPIQDDLDCPSASEGTATSFEKSRYAYDAFNATSSKLGEINPNVAIAFEFYLKTDFLPNYKYRIMFFEHGLSASPVRVMIESDVCDEISLDDVPHIYNDEAQFDDILGRILRSKRVMSIVSKMATYKYS